MGEISSDSDAKEKLKAQNLPATQAEVTPQKKTSRGNKTLLIVIILLLITLICCVSSVLLYSVLRSGEEGTSILDDIKSLFRLDQEGTTTEEDEEEDDGEGDGSEETTDGGGATSTTSSSCVATGFDGEEYAHGDSYTTLDDCQSCTCDNGDWECNVEDRCIAPETDCVFEEENYNIGEEVLSEDGCTRWVCEGVGYMAGYHDDTCCIRHGEYYQDGETLDEECQDCICNEGTWDCDLEPTCCRYGDHVYANGDTFLHEDGCNTCRCTSGSVTCTMMLCP